jgi:hypothetical protein
MVLCKYIFLLLICIDSSKIGVAQTKCPESILEKSYLLAKNNKYTKSIELLNNSLKEYPTCVATFTRLAELYYRTNQVDAAIAISQRAIDVNAKDGLAAAANLLKVIKSYKEDSVANLFASAVMLKVKNDKAINIPVSIIQQLQTKKIQNESLPIQLEDMGPLINEGLNNSFPSTNLEGNTMVFTRVVDGANEDFFITTFDSCTGWQKPKRMDNPPNTGAPEGSPRLSTDAFYLFFTRCDTRSINGWDGGGCDIMYCYKEDDTTWSSPQKFGATINSPGYEGMPCLSSNNKDMYFVSNRPGGFGGKDIWRSRFEGGYWQAPINLGSNINSAGDEEAPFIHPDDHSFYFISNGRKGVGQKDAFYCLKISDTSFAPAQNMGSPINTEKNENSIIINANGHVGYLSKETFDGKYVIEKFEVPQKFKPKETHCVTGKIYDKFTGQTFKATRIHIYDSAMHLLHTYHSNEGDGSFAFPVAGHQLFNIKVDDVMDYNKFNEVLDCRNGRTPIINYDIPIKLSTVIDTLFNKSTMHLAGIDTLLYEVNNNWGKWKRFKGDSIMVYVNFESNTFIDTNMANQYCFSDAGRQAYDKWVDSTVEEKVKTIEAYANFYRKYLKRIGIPESNILFNLRPVYWRKENLFNIDIKIVEYY